MIHLAFDEAARGASARSRRATCRRRRTAVPSASFAGPGSGEDGDLFEWDVAEPFPVPPSVALERGP